MVVAHVATACQRRRRPSRASSHALEKGFPLGHVANDALRRDGQVEVAYNIRDD